MLLPRIVCIVKRYSNTTSIITSFRSLLLLKVDGVISELGLRHVWDTKIGDEESRGVSGGERRRVSIGIQMLLDPSMIIIINTRAKKLLKIFHCWGAKHDSNLLLHTLDIVLKDP